ncbi:MAG TPA: ABC transporter permease, partial [Candidatus Kapabacteria bacterium]|nr:ABC transporter permease [Candidatus Kapabacteria bacterium]
PPPTPSWGQMVSVGLANLTNGYWWLILVPLSAMFLTLIAVVFIGEAIREAFDPKVFSRLR